MQYTVQVANTIPDIVYNYINGKLSDIEHQQHLNYKS